PGGQYAGGSALGVVECWVVLGRRVFEGLCDTLGGGGAGSDGRGYLRPLGNDLSDQTICGFGGATELLDGFKCSQRFGELSFGALNFRGDGRDLCGGFGQLFLGRGLVLTQRLNPGVLFLNSGTYGGRFVELLLCRRRRMLGGGNGVVGSGNAESAGWGLHVMQGGQLGLMVLLGCVGGTASLGSLLFGGLHGGVRNLRGILHLCRCGVRG